MVINPFKRNKFFDDALVDPLHGAFAPDNDFFRYCYGGKGGGSAPPPPDPAATAQAQGQANKEAVRESAVVNQIGTEGPWGRTYFSGDIGSPDRKQVTELSDTGQAVYDSQSNISQTLGGYGQQLADIVAKGPASFSMEGLPSAPWEQDRSDAMKSVEDATYQRGFNLLQPEFERSRDSLETRLANQGITMGSDAYNTELNRFDDSQNRALTDLSLASVNAGRAEDSRLFGLGQSGRNQALSERLTERTQPMNELAAILKGSPALGTPQGVNPGQYGVQPGDIQGATQAAYQGALANYQTQQGARNGMMGNLFNLGGTLGSAYMMSSDRRLKKNIHKVGRLANGLIVYSYQYLFGKARHIGVMAQDALKIMPQAVGMKDGYLTVDYGRILR